MRAPGGRAARPAAPRPERTTSPVSASQTSPFTDWVDESTPATSVIAANLSADPGGD